MLLIPCPNCGPRAQIDRPGVADATYPCSTGAQVAKSTPCASSRSPGLPSARTMSTRPRLSMTGTHWPSGGTEIHQIEDSRVYLAMTTVTGLRLADSRSEPLVQAAGLRGLRQDCVQEAEAQ